ncbi:DUF4349 domain-containing protein [Telluribacter sp. SYSU D00476]|uniref:DUF4349 domain-containing protein n=1 Tax=Telluribacter sp. SYSU D00476 TaxID=2811430 RepID=UPI001FF65D99|nr:DUF4349 domain-containing protein [Telluribacter sp. SYSU D00476]
MKANLQLHVALCISLLLITSCSRIQDTLYDGDAAAVEVDLMRIPPQEASEMVIHPPQEEAMPASPAQGPRKIERKIIRNGRVWFETNDATRTRQLIEKSIRDYKGYISNEEVDKREDKVNYSLTVRVPATNFEAFFASISTSTSLFVSKSVDAKDVTEEYIDVEARLRTKKELESRYKVLLQRAGDVKEVLAIEKEMGTLRTEIESIEGRFRYLNDRIAFSTVQIEYYVVTGQSLAFLSQVGSAFGEGWNNLLTFLLSLISVWPFVLAGLVLVITFISYRRSSRAKQAIQGLQS